MNAVAAMLRPHFFAPLRIANCDRNLLSCLGPAFVAMNLFGG